MSERDDLVARVRAGMSTDEDACEVKRMMEYMRDCEELVEAALSNDVSVLRKVIERQSFRRSS
tara:strand:+ start:83 stop:271 length:189 start_codon:yes stop_codon:yes gene_type:complete